MFPVNISSRAGNFYPFFCHLFALSPTFNISWDFLRLKVFRDLRKRVSSKRNCVSVNIFVMKVGFDVTYRKADLVVFENHHYHLYSFYVVSSCIRIVISLVY